MHLAGQILLQIFLILTNAIFSCVEIAVLSINKTKLSKMAEDGNKKALNLIKLTSKPEKFLATIQIGVTFAGQLGASFAANSFAQPIVSWLMTLGLPISQGVLNTFTLLLITITLSYLSLVLGELVPKRLGMKHSQGIGLAFSGFLNFIASIFSPLVWILTKSTNIILRLLGIDPNEDIESYTEEEIRLMIDAGSLSGSIEQDEKTMIDNIFEFNDTSVEEIMTHRVDIAFIWLEDDIETWEKTLFSTNFTQYPVVGENIDDIMGIFNAKIYFRLEDKSKENVIKKAFKPVFFVPETAPVNLLFNNLRKEKNNFAVVLDEYGGVSGIITLTDVIAEIVGEFEDETVFKKPPMIKKLQNDDWLIQGMAQLDDVAEALNLELPIDEYDTFAGFILSLLGTIPDDGEKPELTTHNMHIKILLINEHRIVSCKVTVLNKIKND